MEKEEVASYSSTSLLFISASAALSANSSMKMEEVEELEEGFFELFI